MKKSYKVGLVGLRRGQGLVSTLASHPQVEIAALCDLKPEVVADLGKAYSVPDSRLYTDFDQFVQAPVDAVVIATPIEYHAPQSIAAMEAGKHVLCEQTVAYTVDECLAVIDAVKRTGKAYMMAENYTYFHYVRQWKELVAQGKLGQIYYAEGEYIHAINHLLTDPKTGEKYWRYTRAPIWYCAHCLGPLLTLMDDRVVRATGAHSNHHTHPGESIAYLDMEVGLFHTEKGAVVKILRSQIAPRHPAMVYYSLYGTKGFVENGRGDVRQNRGFRWLEGERTVEEGAEEIECTIVDPNAPEEARAGGHGTSEFFMVRDFIEALDEGRQPPIDVIRAVDFTIPGILAHEAAMRGGVWLEVPEYGW
ncbi:MAG: Gfo/Idh/MocA family oxidoreductase [Anaerolineae bacterium]|nr:Gfo/Idh/MocA family oxidoreductase [Anaerolineae bacterium]